MNQLLMPAHSDELEAVSSYPSVSIIMSFEPKMKSKSELSFSLNKAILKAELELLEKFQLEIATLVIQKLKGVLKDLNYSTHKKSIAVYVSPVFEKILYLDFEVEERVVVNDSFEIRDLIKSKKDIHEYLLLSFNEKETKIYFDNAETLQQVFANSAEFNENDISEIIFTEKYLQYIDTVLNVILRSFKAPLFVLGNKKVIGLFKNITKHASAIIEYAENSCRDVSPGELKKIINPLTNDWVKVRQQSFRHQLTFASGEKKVVSGIKKVFSEAMRNQGHLLLVEKNYRYPAGYETSNDLIDKAVQPYSQFSYVKDAVDDIIEKVLEENGDVEFVDKEILAGYDHIALIE